MARHFAAVVRRESRQAENAVTRISPFNELGDHADEHVRKLELPMSMHRKSGGTE